MKKKETRNKKNNAMPKKTSVAYCLTNKGRLDHESLLLAYEPS